MVSFDNLMDNDSAIRTASKQILNQELSYEDKFIQQYKISNPDHYELITDKIKQLKEETKTETFKIKNDRQNILAKSVKTKKEFEVKTEKARNFRQQINHRELEKSKKLKEKSDLEFSQLGAINLAHRLKQQFEVQKSELNVELERKEIIIKSFVKKMEDRDREYMSTMEQNNSEVHQTVNLMDREYHNTRDKYTRCLERFNEFMVNQIKTKRES